MTIVGLGGVGGYFGFKLAQYYEHSETVNINFVARENTYTIVKEKGLTLISDEHPNPIVHPHQIVKNVLDLERTSTYLLCIKEYDLENICLQIKSTVKENTIILPLMNGVDIYERIRKIIPNGIVLPACVYIASHIKEKGTIEHKGVPGKIIAGKDPLHPDHDPQQFVAQLKSAGIDISYKEDAFPAIWTKFFFIASFGLVTARYNQPIGKVNSNPELHQRAFLIMQEIKFITSKKGIPIDENIVDQTFEKAASFPADTPTSLQLDVQSGKKNTELALFAGAIINYGQALDIPVPETTKIYQEILEGKRG